MKKMVRIALAMVACGFSSAAFAASNTPSQPKQVKTCADYQGASWQSLGFDWPKELGSVKDACEEVGRTHPDVAKTTPVWVWPYLKVESVLSDTKTGCMNILLGDRSPGTPMNVQSIGNTLRLQDSASRAEVLAMVLRAAVPLYLGVCTVTPEQMNAATALIVSSTTEQIEAVKKQVQALVEAGKLRPEWAAELDLRIQAKIQALEADASGNRGAINTLTSLAGVLEGFLREFYSLDPKKSGVKNGALTLTFRNLDGKEVTYTLQQQGAISVVAEKDSQGFLTAIIINGDRTPIRSQEGAVGPQGPTGPQGPQGPAGTNTVTEIGVNSVIELEQFVEVCGKDYAQHLKDGNVQEARAFQFVVNNKVVGEWLWYFNPAERLDLGNGKVQLGAQRRCVSWKNAGDTLIPARTTQKNAQGGLYQDWTVNLSSGVDVFDNLKVIMNYTPAQPGKNGGRLQPVTGCLVQGSGSCKVELREIAVASK